VKVLIDTHIFLWMLDDVEKISADARAVLEDIHTEVCISPATFYEIGYKCRIGKLRGYDEVAKNMSRLVTRMNLLTLDITSAHAMKAAGLEWAHRDPFDRILAGQALDENLLFLTEDKMFEDVQGLKTLW
jgi:PIN domain nuclease of toxin-antitoxin system